MAATNVQAFSGDVEIAKSLYVDSDTLFVDSVNNRVSIGSTTEAIGSFSVAGSSGLHTQLYNAGAAADNRRWFSQLTGTQYINYIADDDNTIGTTWMAVTRTGTTLNSITFPNGNIGINTSTPASDCKLDIDGVLVGRSTAETSQLYIMPGGLGGGSNSNEYSPGNPHMGTIQVISEQTSNDEFSSMCVINKDRDNNVTKNASIGFFTTDTSGTGKYVGKIGFWPVDANSTTGEFRIYTAGTNAGYDFPVNRMVVKNNGNVDITTAGGILTVTGEVRGRKDTDTTSYFGRAAVGYCGIGDHMAISHHDVNNSQSYALLQAANGTTYLNTGVGRALNFRENNANKMVLNNGKLGIAYSAGHYPISINGGLYTKKWNAFDNNTTASNYTFPESGIYFVGFMYANGDDGNISEYYTITAAKGGASAGVTKHKNSGYLNYAVQSYDTVRFWAGSPSNALPSNYNSSNFYLVIYAAGYQ